MIEAIWRWWKKRRVRKAQERYAYWKARREMLEVQLKDACFAVNAYNRNSAISAAGKEAMFMERAEILIRELNEGK